MEMYEVNHNNVSPTTSFFQNKIGPDKVCEGVLEDDGYPGFGQVGCCEWSIEGYTD